MPQSTVKIELVSLDAEAVVPFVRCEAAATFAISTIPDWTVEILLRSQGGAMEVVGARVEPTDLDGPPLDARAWRDIPLERLGHLALQAIVERVGIEGVIGLTREEIDALIDATKREFHGEG